MIAQIKIDFESAKTELAAIAGKSGALVSGIAAADAFDDAPQGYRPVDLLPHAKSVFVIGGAQPRAGDWQSPNYQHMEVTSTSDRMQTLALKIARIIEDRFSYYAAIITTLPMPADKPLDPPACPAPECVQMYAAEKTTPCLKVCPVKAGGCLGGRIEDGRFTERQYDSARCATRVQNYWVPAFQKMLGATLQEPDADKQKMMLFSSMFSRTLWSMTYSNVSQGQCAECMRVCPVGREHRTKN